MYERHAFETSLLHDKLRIFIHSKNGVRAMQKMTINYQQEHIKRAKRNFINVSCLP